MTEHGMICLLAGTEGIRRDISAQAKSQMRSQYIQKAKKVAIKYNSYRVIYLLMDVPLLPQVVGSQ